jgi:hypothetical protein
MHTHHAWVLLEKFLSLDFWLLENLGCYTSAVGTSQISHGVIKGKITGLIIDHAITDELIR